MALIWSALSYALRPNDRNNITNSNSNNRNALQMNEVSVPCETSSSSYAFQSCHEPHLIVMLQIAIASKFFFIFFCK